MRKKFTVVAAALSLVSLLFASENGTGDEGIQPVVVSQLLEHAKKNSNWKVALVTGRDAQIVLMNVSPLTNPNNEIGIETHPFDQVVLIVEGKGKAIINERASIVKEGDMVFIPQGTPHNIINQDHKKSLKLISFYSDTDIPSGAIYKKKADAP